MPPVKVPGVVLGNDLPKDPVEKVLAILGEINSDATVDLDRDGEGNPKEVPGVKTTRIGNFQQVDLIVTVSADSLKKLNRKLLAIVQHFQVTAGNPVRQCLITQTPVPTVDGGNYSANYTVAVFVDQTPESSEDDE